MLSVYKPCQFLGYSLRISLVESYHKVLLAKTVSVRTRRPRFIMTGPSKEVIESAKRKAASRAISEHFSSDFTHVGIGSGTTILYGIEAIKSHLSSHAPPSGHKIYFVPTGEKSKKSIEDAGLLVRTYDELEDDVVLDVAFDGADEVDEDMNCIKGGGKCLFQEKLVATRAKKFVVIADYRKDQKRLLTSWPSIPIEVAPIAYRSVIQQLKEMGSKEPKLRIEEDEKNKSQPARTDQGFYIIDAPFEQTLNEEDVKSGKKSGKVNGVYDVASLAIKIKAITGVLEVGLFFTESAGQTSAQNTLGGQRPVAAYFGTEDGNVSVRKIKGTS